jgi:tripartite-type tricarboxylate transporter receptor subunit TctC
MARLLPVGAVALVISLNSVAPGFSQDWPTRPVTMVIPFAAGGPADTVGRILAPGLSEILGQQVIIENVGGSGGMAGASPGRIDYQCPDTPIAIPQIQSKMVKAIAILTRNRSPSLPAQATAHEQGLTNFDASNWFAAFFPKGTSAAAIDKLHAAILATIDTPAVKTRMQQIGADLVTGDRSSPDYLQGFVESEINKWAGPIKASGISMD